MRYKVTIENATLVVEIDAPDAEAAKADVYEAFKASNANDPLEGTRIHLPDRSTNAMLMTTSVYHSADIEAEEI